MTSTSRRGVLWWDFDGTLVTRPSMWTEAAMRLLDRVAPRHSISTQLIDQQLGAGLPWQRADFSHPELASSDMWWNAVYHRYTDIFAALGFSPPTLRSELEILRRDILDASRYRVFDDVVPSLQRACALGWGNLVVSNHVPELQQLVADLGLMSFFDGVVSSGVVGYEKPHERLFAAAMCAAGPARPIWMIGDNVDADCSPVRGLGHHAVLVRCGTAGAFTPQASDLMAALDIIESGTSAS